VISPTPIDASTGRGLIPNLGSLVQVHFSESRGERVAALVVAESAQLPLTPVKDLEQSVLGEAKRFKSRTLVVEIDGHTRDVSLNDDTQLVDRNGSVRAVGTKAIKAALVAGTMVLVTWKPFWVPRIRSRHGVLPRRRDHSDDHGVAARREKCADSEVKDERRRSFEEVGGFIAGPNGRQAEPRRIPPRKSGPPRRSRGTPIRIQRRASRSPM
jgi:hypothetical protein